MAMIARVGVDRGAPRPAGFLPNLRRRTSEERGDRRRSIAPPFVFAKRFCLQNHSRAVQFERFRAEKKVLLMKLCERRIDAETEHY